MLPGFFIEGKQVKRDEKDLCFPPEYSLQKWEAKKTNWLEKIKRTFNVTDIPYYPQQLNINF